MRVQDAGGWGLAAEDGRVDDEDLARGLVGVDGDVLAVDDFQGRVADREELEILEEPGLDRADERGEAGDVLPVGPADPVVEDALLDREGGAHDHVLGWGAVLLPVPRDECLMGAGDVEDVPLELALLELGVGRVHAHPVPVAQAVGR